ncbi:DUF4401 domain-containing protein [Flagellimonas algicola]|uniref:DUF4401 domain-containing protein n=1 Tax=Flagellimonas algicola TaxID=2583815 RepID=A0ABY2WJT9_9FLAO|nr:DUF4401 domain-containing protein [Allomuricauda algicola]TMU55106.1 DUF4401 domain-containing protein [Allomuricauda algicola]
MERTNRVKTFLETIQETEGEHFQFDESAILEALGQDKSETSSLAIKVLSIFGGFLASLAFLGFLFILGVYESEVGMIVLGALFILGALILNKTFDRLIIDTFSISIYLIGFALVIIALLNLDVNEDVVTLLVLITALGSLFVTQTYMLSFLSILGVGGCFLILIISNDQYNLIHLYLAVYALLLVYCFLNEATFFTSGKKLSKLHGPIRIGLLFSFLIGLIALGKRGLFPIDQNYIWLSSVVSFFAVLYLVKDLIKVVGVVSGNTKSLIYILSVAVLLPAVMAPAISGAILIILLSFNINYRTGLAIGIIALTYFVSQYYYDLNLTLLTKSIILFSSGVVFLLFYLFTLKMTKK